MDLALYADERNPDAAAAGTHLRERYEFVPAAEANAGVVVGGDGYMLHTLHRMLAEETGLPLYGLNRGTIGFLMNTYEADDLPKRVASAVATVLHPLQMTVTTTQDEQAVELAINEVALFRASAQTAKIRITLDGEIGLSELVGDGVLVSTAAGSTAYNRSAGGPIVPLSARMMAVTPIAAFHPRGWRGALLAYDSRIRFDVLQGTKRPVHATADSREVADVACVEVIERSDLSLRLLFDPGHGLEARIIEEQFVT